MYLNVRNLEINADYTGYGPGSVSWTVPPTRTINLVCNIYTLYTVVLGVGIYFSLLRWELEKGGGRGGCTSTRCTLTRGAFPVNTVTAVGLSTCTCTCMQYACT